MGRRYFVVLLAGLLAWSSGCADFAGIGDPKLAPSCVIGGVDLCTTNEPENTLTFDTDVTVNTSTDCNVIVFVPPSKSLCVIYARDIVVRAKVSAVGTRPFVLAAANTLLVEGDVDVSSYRGKSTGAAANDPTCDRDATSTMYGGSAGGSFIGKGGDGGSGYMSNAGQVAAPTVPMPDTPRGGCPSPAEGNGGGSGGALWLAARTSISIAATGRVLASGGGGASGFGAGGIDGGTSGGGSGGLIRLASASISILGVVAANGGGGAEGVDGLMTATHGADGGANAIPALGGAGASMNGGDGGNGGAGTTPNGTNGTAAGGTMAATGGGGGGGVGAIQLYGEMLDMTGTVSPSAVTTPP